MDTNQLREQEAHNSMLYVFRHLDEEYGELAVAFTKLCQGVNDKETLANLKEEAAQVAVTAIRLLEALEKK